MQARPIHRQILRDPSRNKGYAFTMAERRHLQLGGWLPPCPQTKEQEITRFMTWIRRCSTPLEKYVALANLRYGIISFHPVSEPALRSATLFPVLSCDSGALQPLTNNRCLLAQELQHNVVLRGRSRQPCGDHASCLHPCCWRGVP